MNDKTRKFIRNSIIYFGGFIIGCIVGVLLVVE